MHLQRRLLAIGVESVSKQAFGCCYRTCQAPAATLWCAVKGTDPQREINPPGNWFVPPGSNRSNGGGNEVVGAFGVEGRDSDSASMQAVM
jgi:hypothetical protein